jgi:hypothetical protein
LLKDNAVWLIWLPSRFSDVIPHSVKDNRFIEVREATDDDMFVEMAQYASVCQA